MQNGQVVEVRFTPAIGYELIDMVQGSPQYVTESHTFTLPPVSGLNEESDGTMVSINTQVGTTLPVDVTVAFDGQNGLGSLDAPTSTPGSLFDN